MTRITLFSGAYNFLSNFAVAKVRWHRIDFPTAEHAYQASKVAELADKEMIAKLPTPGKAKRAGQKVALIPCWEEFKLPTMLAVVTAKFEQNPVLMDKLVRTGFAMLEEGNIFHDNFWGDCRCEQCKDIKGQNHLGKILMQVRDDHTGR